MQYKLDLWSKDGFDLKQLLLPQLPLDRYLNANLICHISLCVPYNYMCLATYAKHMFVANYRSLITPYTLRGFATVVARSNESSVPYFV